MKNISVNSIDQLKEAVSSFGQDALYRGQTQIFGSPDAPKMSTSFSRNGCIPTTMLRWSHHARFILAALLGQDQREVSLEFTQAILQHYGWRSFYLDASSNPAVSAWFASHVLKLDRSIHICEDCYEDAVFLVKRIAKYTVEEGIGNLFVLSKQAIAENALGLVDLTTIELQNFRPRFHAQAAWLVGPLHNDLPIDCVLGTISGPMHLFRDFAKENGIVHTNSLFPTIEEDPVLKSLTSMPWKRFPLPDDTKDDIDFFTQELELPEYHDSFRKHSPPHIAYYDGGVAMAKEVPTEIVFYDVPEMVVYGYADPIETRFPLVTKIVESEGLHIVFEIDNIVRRPGRLSSDYIKGVAVSKRGDGLFSLADFAVEHPGRRIVGCGINMGWHYRIAEDGRWIRELVDDDCSCGNISVHQHHLSMLTILEDHLVNKPSTVSRRATKARKQPSGS